MHAQRCIIAHGVARLQVAHLHYRGPKAYHRLRLQPCTLTTSDAVKKNAGPDEIPLAPTPARDRGAVVGVEKRRARWECGKRLAESRFLFGERSIVQLRRMKVSKRTLWRHSPGRIHHARDLAPRNACSAHACVDREVPWPSATLAPRIDLVGETERRHEARSTQARQVSG